MGRKGVALMSRRRSSNPTKAISITLPLKLIEQIDDKLTRTSSRSAWIATACMNELIDDHHNLNERQLMAALHYQTDSEVLKTLLMDRFTSSSPS